MAHAQSITEKKVEEEQLEGTDKDSHHMFCQR